MLELADYNLSIEQIEFRDTLRRFFGEHASMSSTRAVLESESGVSATLWRRACDDLGLPALAIAEDEGGQGFGLPELAIALGETGRALAPVPLFAVAGLAIVVVQSVTSSDERRSWMQGFAKGEIGTLAWVEANGSWSVGDVSTRASASGEISGEKCFVLDADAADRYFVVGRSVGSRDLEGLSLYAVEADAPGVERTRVQTLDPTRRLFRVRFDDAPGRLVGAHEAAGAAIESALDKARALHCAERLGGMQRVLESAVDYAQTRHQFGRPIGSFQAIKHKAADMLIDFESARTVVAAAVEAVADDAAGATSDAALLVSVANAHTGPAYVRMATENLQIHGGVGYTWEYDAHLYFRRAQSSSIFLGEAGADQDRIAQTLAASISGAATS